MPDWVPAGAWAAFKVGRRVFTNWAVMGIIAAVLTTIITVGLIIGRFTFNWRNRANPKRADIP